jgi:hypothetical protein
MQMLLRNEKNNGFRLVYPIRGEPSKGSGIADGVALLDWMPMTLLRPRHWSALGLPFLDSARRRSEIHDKSNVSIRARCF